MAAAVADFRPAAAGRDQDQEAGRAGSRTRSRLVQNPDILAGLAAPGPDRPAGGRRLRRRDRRRARLARWITRRDKLARKGCDLLVVNRVDGGRAFEVADNAGRHPVRRRSPDRRCEIPFGPKTVLAAAVCDAIAARLDPTPPDRHSDRIDRRPASRTAHGPRDRAAPTNVATGPHRQPSSLRPTDTSPSVRQPAST